MGIKKATAPLPSSFRRPPFPFKMLLLALSLATASVHSAEVDTALPALPADNSIAPINVDLPKQPLDVSLKQLARLTGFSLAFDSKLASNKTAPAIKGRMHRGEALHRLLAGSGLEAAIDGDSAVIKPIPDKEVLGAKLNTVEVRAKRFYEVGPLPGLGLTKNEIPGNVQSITAEEIKESHSLSLTDLMNSKLQSVSVNDYQSNPFQMDVNYRGFTASPQLGTAQGISVFLDGIRVNEPFGDIVNWDMIPMNALSSLDVFPGSNPIFGLGTLGGALVTRTKSGFEANTLDAEVLTGSFGRKQLQVSAGGNNGVVAGFIAGNFFLEDGWRDDSPSRVNQIFGKGEWQSENVRLGLSALYAGNKLTGNGLLPQQMVDQNPKQVYTSPDESENDLLQFQLSGIWDVSDTFNVTGQIYKRNSKRKSSTSDVNENFGGLDQRPNVASARSDPNAQMLPGLPDVNRDGLPDYNDYAMNVAADEFGNPLTTSGTACIIDTTPGAPLDPCVNDLAYGTNFNTQAVAGQAQVSAQDGSGATVWNWTYDPRRWLDFSGPNGELAESNVPGAFNAPVSSDYAERVRYAFANKGLLAVTNYLNGAAQERILSSTLHPGTGSSSYHYEVVSAGTQGVLGGYTDQAGFFHDYWELFTPINLAYLQYTMGTLPSAIYNNSGIPAPILVDANGNHIYRDGKYGGGAGYSATGFIEGTPTAIFTDTEIDQLGTGGSLQLNWNLEKHKFMLGASVDKSDSTYASKQYLGFLDENRHGYTAPEALGWEYYANGPANGVALNDFSGEALTKSIYASETWTPVETLNITASARFNHSTVDNQLAVNRLSSFGDVNRILNIINYVALCPDNNNDGVVDPATECPNGMDDYIVPFDESYANVDASGQPIASLRPPEKEEFKYRSFNPSLGFTWQAHETLNLYGTVGRGARTPTVIELGCAWDPTPVLDGYDANGKPHYRPRSISEQRVCNLPGAMSGDPYLKQVRSTTMEFGGRGQLTPDIEWNASVYRTDLTDDIYFVSVNAASSFFQNIGDTRRQGIEFGLKGKWGKAKFGLNYALTDATFQSTFSMLSPHNSSAVDVYDVNHYTDEGRFGSIKVKPNNRIPGIPLHNINANFSYDVTDKWTVGFNAIMHSSSYVRGNENNGHRAGPASPITGPFCVDPATGSYPSVCTLQRADWGPGKTPGYTVVNFRTSYKFTPEWTLSLLVNNIFDREYFTAGRLGLNAFSPSINGAIGPGGFNYNSSDWQGTSFVGTAAPRAAWITLGYQFVPRK